MKQTTNMARVIGEIQRIARLINRDWFNSELPMEECIFTVQSTPKAYAHFTPYLAYRVHDKEGERAGVEINLGAGTLDRAEGIDYVCSSLIHEMTHWYNWLHGVKDTSNGNTYHNHFFKESAEKHGIIISYAKTIGWSVTRPSDELTEWCIDNDLEEFRLGRNEFTSYYTGGGDRAGNPTYKPTLPTVPKKGNSHKLICPCCGTTVRYTTSKTPNIICGDCNEQMIDG